MDRISEPQLREYNEARSITAARIVRHLDGYVLVVRVSWKKADLIVFSQRNKPRLWKSLDRLIAHLADVAPSIRKLEMVLEDGILAKQLPAD